MQIRDRIMLIFKKIKNTMNFMISMITTGQAQNVQLRMKR